MLQSDLNAGVIPMIDSRASSSPICLWSVLLVNSVLSIHVLANPYSASAVVMRFEPERLIATAATPTSTVAVAMMEDEQYTGGRALRWETDTTAEAMRIEGAIPWSDGGYLAMRRRWDGAATR